MSRTKHHAPKRAVAADNTARNQSVGRPFSPGQSGNPKDRPKGARKPPRHTVPRRGRGRPSKYDPRYIPIVRELILRGLNDVDIAKMLQIDESTLYDWKLRHAEFSQAMQRSKVLVCDRLEATMVMRANGFERKIEKATASGRKVVINEYFPPETAAGKFLLQHRRPEVFREQREVKQLVGVEQGFLTFLQGLDDKAKLERETGNLPQLLEHQVTSESDDECG